MKPLNSLTKLLLLSFFGVASTASPNSIAADLSIAVVDMQKALNSYNRTKVEVERINVFYSQKAEALEEKGAVAKEISVKAEAVGQEARDSALNQEAREKKAATYRSLMGELNIASKEIVQAKQKSSQELMKARQDMENALLQDIKTVMSQLAKAEKIDLVLDRSFLPKANKMILFQSDNVIDLTDRIIEILNAE